MAAPMVFENRYDVPADYAGAWLTDFRPEDGGMFGVPPASRVERRGDQVFTEARNPLGDLKGVATIESPARWHARSEVTRRGKVVMVSRIVETVRPDGRGSLHRAEITMEPQTLGMRLLWPLFRGMMRASMRKGFAEMKRRMEAQFRAGKPPTA